MKTWPWRIGTVRAKGLGFSVNASFEAVIRDDVRENPDAVKLPIAA